MLHASVCLPGPPPCACAQVQRLKLDTEAAMLELDQILRANVGVHCALPAGVHFWVSHTDTVELVSTALSVSAMLL